MSRSQIGGNETIRVLHVDDEREWNKLSSAFLEEINADIDVVGETNPESALKRISADAIDCVISDYQMPRMNGVEFLRAVREDYPNLPFILFTDRGSETVAVEATTAGVTAYVKKGGRDVYRLLANQVEQNVSRRRSERRARIANDRLLTLYEQTDGFYLLDHDWTILYWNREMAARTSHPADEVLGDRFWDVFPEAVDTDLYDQLRKVRESGEASEFDLYYEPRDHWVEIRAYPSDDGLFVHSRDITAEKNIEEELTNRNRILESFANTVSHDLRNPLTIAEGRLRLAQETGDFTHLDDVARAHNRMRNLIDDLLRLARGVEPDASMVSLRESATQAWETISSGETRLDVVDDTQFLAYGSQLRRLLENLYWNAIDHGNATTVRVGTLDGGFYVEDDGDGIQPERREKIFDVGFSTSETGTGYGLHIVENIVTMHDWDISVTAGCDGGARFEIRGVCVSEDDS